MSTKMKKRKNSKTEKKENPKPVFQDGDTMLLFLSRVTQWLQAPLNFGRVVNLFSKFDSDGDNLLSPDDFTVAMRMMEVPATRAEIDSLIKIIDPEGSGKVNILQFDKIICDHKRELQQQASQADGDQEFNPSSATDLVFSPSRLSVKCKHCQVGLAGPPLERHPKFIKLKLTLVPFKDFKKHPGHFEQEVTESTTIQGLKCLIMCHLEDSVSSVALFKEPSCSKSSFLDPEWCLGHCGITGGTKTDPVWAEVFYDYIPIMNGCPILMDDSHIRDVFV